jgi:hypothetical protein
MFCHHQAETSDHIFFRCTETLMIWKWLYTAIDQHLDCADWLSLITGCVGNWSKLVQQVLIAAVLQTVWKIWIERNDRYFNNKEHSMEHLIRSIFVEVGSSYNIIQTEKSVMFDAKLSHLFSIPLKHKTLSSRYNVRWCPPGGRLDES